MDYILHIIIMLNIYIILGVCTNLLVGVANLVSMGQAAFFGLGAYCTAFCMMYLHLSLLPTLVCITLLNALFSLPIALSSLRLKGEYFILASMGFQLITYTILYNWVSVTKGPYGISGIPSPILWGNIQVSETLGFVLLSTCLMLIIVGIFYALIYSPFGRVLRAMREDELTVMSLGRNVVKFKVTTFALSAAFISWAGLLYGTYISYIDPTSFNLDESIFILSAVLIGGIGNIRGSVVGALFVVLLPEILRFVGLPDAIAANMRQIIYGIFLIVLMRYRPQGIAGNLNIE